MKTPPKSNPLLLYICAPLLILLLAFRNAPTSLAFITYSIAVGLAFAAAPSISYPIGTRQIFIWMLLFSLGLNIGREVFFSPEIIKQFRIWITVQYFCLSALSFLIAFFFILSQRERTTDDATPL